MKPSPDPHYRHRFPVEVISHAVWLYHVFSLSLRDVELLLAERGVTVSFETVRRWCQKFGGTFAHAMRRRRPRPGDKWHMEEVSIRIQGVQHYLWRAVDQDGVVLDILVQPRRDACAATRFFKRLLNGLQYLPRVIVTDRLKSYGVARRALHSKVEHRQSRYLNNRAENSHRPTRRRERQVQRFKSPVRAGAQDLVLATRTRGGRESGAMAWHQVLAGRLPGLAMRLLYDVPYTDMCAFRAIGRDALARPAMREMGYGWNLEMQMLAARSCLGVLEVPLPYRRRAGSRKWLVLCAAVCTLGGGLSQPCCGSHGSSANRAHQLVRLLVFPCGDTVGP